MSFTRTLRLAVLLTAFAATGCDDAGDTVGPEGGVVTSLDGRVTLDIPAGALDDDVAITIGAVDDGPAGAVGRTYEILPRSTQLLFPAMIEVDLADAKADGAASLELSAAALETLSITTERGDAWESLADLEVDADAGVVTASVMFFSTYAVVVE